MSLENKKPQADILNIEHNDTAEAKNSLLHGKTTGGDYVPVKLNDDGSLDLAEITSLEELSDVDITTPVADNELLSYDFATSEWINQTATEAGLLTSPIDISSDTNLAVDSPIILTDDTLSLGTIDISDDTNLTVDGSLLLTDDELSVNRGRDFTWTGDHSFSGDVSFSGEVTGTKQSITFTRQAEFNVGIIARKSIKLGEVLMTTSKGFTPIRNGSIVGLSVNYDNTINGKVSNLDIVVKNGGTDIWTNALSTVTGTNRTAAFTQAKDTDTYSAEDNISIWFSVSGMMGASVDLENVIVTLEYYYDD